MKMYLLLSYLFTYLLFNAEKMLFVYEMMGFVGLNIISKTKNFLGVSESEFFFLLRKSCLLSLSSQQK